MSWFKTMKLSSVRFQWRYKKYVKLTDKANNALSVFFYPDEKCVFPK